jgi:hypothetical protein
MRDAWLGEAGAAAELGKSVRTLRDWRKRGVGPPYALFGRTIKYNRQTLAEHFKAKEITPVRERETAK